jgi:hypothetical protein
MTIDLKGYIIGVLHIECKLAEHEINYALVDDILLTIKSNESLRNADYIKNRYFSSESAPIDSVDPIKVDELSTLEVAGIPPVNSELKNNDNKQPRKVEGVYSGSNNVNMTPTKSVTLPNGKVNEEYSQTIPLKTNGLENIDIVSITGLDQAGLSYNQQDHLLTGIPKESGDFVFKMGYKIIGDHSDKPLLARNLLFYVNPDPRSLWTESEPDSTLPFPKSHTAHEEIEYLGKRVIAASKRGRSHAKDGKFRDDHFQVINDAATGWLVLAVSDGAGSAKLSREGSKIFCQTVTNEIVSESKRHRLEELESCLTQEESEKRNREIKNCLYYLIGEGLLKAYRELEERAATVNSNIKDFSCTFLLSLCKKVNDKWFVAGYWVGDGGLGIAVDNDDPVILGSPDSGEFSGQTRFVNSPELLSSEGIYERIKFIELPEFKYLALMTDGITDAWFHTDSNLYKSEKWEELWSEISKNQTSGEAFSSVALLEWLDFWVKGEYDDRTIIILN